MHEASIAAPLLRLVLEETERHGHDMKQSLHVTRVCIRAGLLQDLDARCLQGIFSIMAEGSPAADAVLEVNAEPMRGHCPDCDTEVRIESRDFHCPVCHGENVAWQGGNELFIESLSVHPDNDAHTQV